MNVLLVFCHPAAESFQRSILGELSGRLQADGHDLRILDLYAEGFDPVLDEAGWRAHLQQHPQPAGLEADLAALGEAEGLILLYPTWWYGLPAMLKGWIDRVWQPGLAFTIQDGAFRTHTLTRIRRFAAITTYGSPRLFIEWIVGDPARRHVMRGLALQLARRARARWEPIYGVDARSQADLARARARVVRRVAGLFREPNGAATRS